MGSVGGCPITRELIAPFFYTCLLQTVMNISYNTYMLNNKYGG